MPQQPPVIFLAFANDKAEGGVYLRNLSLEMHNITEALKEAERKGVCEVVVCQSATINNVIDTLQDPRYQGRIAVFHYGGHASGDALLLETADGGHSLALKGGLVDILSSQDSLKLAFFNGCSSDGQTNELVDKGVPAAIGTTSAINDTIATLLATRFYTGLGLESTIGRAWQDAVAQAKMTDGITTTDSRGLNWSGKTEQQTDLPWQLKYKNEQDNVKEWNLAEAAGDPLFGLPELPIIDLPPSPFVHLGNYDRAHAGVFVGRARFTRDLYLLVTSEQTQPVLLLYGQAGVGKTSLLQAGVLPRLEKTHQTVIVTRDEAIGMRKSLFYALMGLCGYSKAETQDEQQTLEKETAVLASLEQIATTADIEAQAELAGVIQRMRERYAIPDKGPGQVTPPVNVLEAWLMAERLLNKPVVIALDHVERTFTKDKGNLSEEATELFTELRQVFSDAQKRPKGKLILCYRAEYHPAIDNYCRAFDVPKGRMLLENLGKGDVKRIFWALTSFPTIQAAYNVAIDDGLDDEIALTYTRGSTDSPVGPFLQILLTSMWEKAQANGATKATFSRAIYDGLQEDASVIREFLQKELEVVEERLPDAYNSGLVLDLLYFHCSRTMTSARRTEKEILARYPYAQGMVKDTLALCKELLLLVQASNAADTTILGHDMLALAVSQLYLASTRVVQQAYRLLGAGAEAINAGTKNDLNQYEIDIMDRALPYLRALTPEENDLIKRSKKDVETQAKSRRNMAITKSLLVALSTAAAVIYAIVYLQLQTQEQQTYITKQAAASSSNLNTDNTHSLLMAARGYETDTLNPTPEIRQAITNAFYTAVDSGRPFYRCLVRGQNAFLNIAYSSAKEAFVPFPQDSTGYIYDVNGVTLARLYSGKRRAFSGPFSLLSYVMFTADNTHIIALGSDSVVRVWDMAGHNIYHTEQNVAITYFICTPGNNSFITLADSTIRIQSFVRKKTKIIKLRRACKAIKMNAAGDQLLILYVTGELDLISLDKKDNTIATEKRALPYHAAVVNAVFSKTDRYVLASYADSSLTLWDTSGKVLNTFPKLDGNVMGMDFRPSDSVFIVYSGHTGYLFRTDNFKPWYNVVHQQDLITFAKFSSDGRKLISGSSDKTCVIWDLQDGTHQVLLGHDNDITAAFFSDGDHAVITCSLDGTVRSWNLDTYKKPSVLAHRGMVTSMQMHPTGPYLASVGNDNTLSIWRMTEDRPGALTRTKNMNAPIGSPSFSRRGEKVICTMRNGAFVWDWTMNNTVLLAGHSAGTIGAVFMGDNKTVTIADDQTLRFWDDTGRCYKVVALMNDSFCTISASKNGSRVAGGTKNGLVYVFDSNGKATDTLRRHRQGMDIVSCSFSANGQKIVTASEDNTAIIWDLQQKRSIVLNAAIQAHYYILKINRARFSDDGKYVLTASSDRAARVWTSGGMLMATLYGHTDNVLDAMFTPHGQIVTYSTDGTIRYWLPDGHEIAKYTFNKEAITSVVVSNTGEAIYSAGPTGKIYTWLTPRGIFARVRDAPFYKYYKQHSERYHVNKDDEL